MAQRGGTHGTTTRSELIARALAVDDDDNEYWQIVRLLRARGDQHTFEAAADLTRTGTPRERRLGVDIIAEFTPTAGSRPFLEQALPILLERSRIEHDHETLASVISALGRQHDPSALRGVLAHVAHASSHVRLYVAMTLPALAHDPMNPPPDILSGLQTLMVDQDAGVRDWATFGLGQMLDADLPEIRQALLERTHDSDDVTAGEALRGLAGRGDRRITPALRDRLLSLARPGADAQAVDLCAEAAALLGDQELLPALTHLDTYRRRTGAVSLGWLESAIEQIAT
jgi:HEAT repeat protein